MSSKLANYNCNLIRATYYLIRMSSKLYHMEDLLTHPYNIATVAFSHERHILWTLDGHGQSAASKLTF